MNQDFIVTLRHGEKEYGLGLRPTGDKKQDVRLAQMMGKNVEMAIRKLLSGEDNTELEEG